MNRISALLFATLAVCASCGASTPEVRYYRVAAVEQENETSSEIVIGVEPFATDAAYDAQKIVYRSSPYRVDYYHYHRWAAPPGIMVADYTRDALESTGKFRAVASGFTADAVAMVGGRIIHFEEVDESEDSWKARLKIVVTLRNAETGSLEWSKTVVREEALETQNPEGLARAMSAALGHMIEETAPEIYAVSERLSNQRISAPAPEPER